MGKIVYITAKAPFGRLGETYILTELLAHKELGTDLLIVPRDTPGELFHEKARTLLGDTLGVPILNVPVVGEFLKYLIMHPVTSLKLFTATSLKARNIGIAIKNLLVFPKACYIAGIIKKSAVAHIHAHYGSTTSTMAYIISRISGIPWSFTVHRWDIPENNILRIKLESASFLRAIDENGREEVKQIVKSALLADKIKVIHMGARIPEKIFRKADPSGDFTFLCPAMLVPKKGHRYLLEAGRQLSRKGVRYKCLIAGEGPLKDELREMATRMNLNGNVELLGALSQEEILELYGSGRVGAVILPSIVTEDGDKEGIPVALMEAMSYGIPVISTDTGGIPELIGDGSGIMVPERDPEAIAFAMERLINDRAYCVTTGEKGRGKVERDFNMRLSVQELMELFLRGRRVMGHTMQINPAVGPARVQRGG
jgi:colanic acid/amylovoran biosynthesis glycosyltransferase